MQSKHVDTHPAKEFYHFIAGDIIIQYVARYTFLYNVEPIFEIEPMIHTV